SNLFGNPVYLLARRTTGLNEDEHFIEHGGTLRAEQIYLPRVE
ncbi:hypothetical protein LCGC14_3039970, partial [marine sediment metagenome]